jgi:hypothetical protein
MNVPEVLINLVDVFVIMRRYNINGAVKRVAGELVETAGMEEKKVLLSSLWYYDLPKREFIETAVSSVYRDRLAAVSGRSPREIMLEIKTRARIIKALADEDKRDSRQLTELFRRYCVEPHSVLDELRLKREDSFK